MAVACDAWSEAPAPEPVARAQPEWAEVPVAVGGEEVREVPPDRPTERSPLTRLDLGDDFAPRIFSPAPELGELGTPGYRAIYLALADERLDELPEEVERERYLEVFGIFPTFRVMAQRVGDVARHACHRAVDPAGLRTLPYRLRPGAVDIASERRRVRAYERELERFRSEQSERGLDSLDALEGVTERGRAFEQFLRDRARVELVRAVQAHLRCDGFLPPPFVDGVLDHPTARGLAEWQRRHMRYGGGSIDPSTVETMRVPSEELDFRQVLRALRERVVDATGAIEDGSAAHAWGTVLGRTLDAPELRATAGRAPLPAGAPDWISPATEAAAEALGWTSPQAFLARAADLPEVALVELPSLPPYHEEHMDLWAEIDRGDVRYDLPRDPRGLQAVPDQRPVMTLYAKDGERAIPLVRWPTTIGSWKEENAPGGWVALKYKESPVGPRVWRDMVVAPAWIPPDATPVDELVRRVGPRRVVADTTLFGPGYRSAYGLVMMVHHRRRSNPLGPGDPLFVDEGVRIHGSVAYRSILTGSSHGCHRLHNHLAVRLTGFLLAHRRHVRRGSLFIRYSRVLRTRWGPVTFRIRSRGFAYELTPPVDVEVLEGHIVGRRRTPDPRYRPIPR